jgi:hypothetical protein
MNYEIGFSDSSSLDEKHVPLLGNGETLFRQFLSHWITAPFLGYGEENGSKYIQLFCNEHSDSK